MFTPEICQSLDYFQIMQRLEKLEEINEEALKECLNYEAQNLKQERGEKDE